MGLINEFEYPLVTVFVPCYNHENYVLEALESVKNQTYKNFELIICDDCSTDNSVSVIKKWILENKIQCQFIVHKENQGICRSMNEMLSKANGKYYSGCTSDDVLLPEKLERQVKKLEELGDEYGIVFSDTYIINENSELQSDTFHSKYFRDHLISNNNYFITLLRGNVIHGLAATFRTDILRAIDGYDEKLFAEDWDLNIRLSLKTKIYFDTDYISAKYRILPNSLNNDPGKRVLAVNSTCKSFTKFIGISSESDNIVFENIYSWANELRYRHSDLWRKWYRFLFFKKPNKRTFKYFLISIFK